MNPSERAQALTALVAHAEQHNLYEVTMGDKPPVSNWRIHRWQTDHGFVRCDSDCGALADPALPAEYQAALEHWQHHGVTGGCAHGH